MLHAAIFDIDNTVYSYDRAHETAWAALCGWVERVLGLTKPQFEDLHRQASAVLDRRCGGGAAIHDRMLRYQILLELAGLPLRHAHDMSDLYWTAFLGDLRPEPGVVETFAALKALGLRVGIGTNMLADRQLEKLRLLGLEPFVDFFVSSEEVNAEKPDPRLFALCVEKAGCAAADCLFVGDSLQKDALAVAAAGLRGCWYCPGNRPAAAGVWTIRALGELPDLIRRENAV